MSKRFKNKRRLNSILLAIAVATTMTATSFAACKNTDDNVDEEETKTSAVDTQLLKNGNFEFFDVPKAEKDGNEPVYLINTPLNWTHGDTSSYTKSGIINTSKSAWDTMSADDLAKKLDINNSLKKDDANYKQDYVDYNGMKSSDILYKDTYKALAVKKTEENGKDVYKLDNTEVYLNEDNGDYYYDQEFTKPLKEKLDNPQTHYNVEGNDTEGYYYLDEKGERVKVYKDEKGDYYLEYDETTKTYSKTFSNILMLRNYTTSSHNGIAQNYASVSVDLPANTAAEISLWVKTSNLLFKNGTEVTQDRGAYISVSQTVGGTNLDDFRISCINTEKLIENDPSLDRYNGWVQYTVYVNACDFASSTISLKLGLGESNYTVEGYAFFDDVTVKKFSDLSDSDCSYSQNKPNDSAKCTLSSTAEQKVFIADQYERNGGAENGGISDARSSKNFRYFIDLASESGYKPFNFVGSYLEAGLTVDSDNYVSSKGIVQVRVSNMPKTILDTNVKLPSELKNIKVNNEANGLDTTSDLLAFKKASERFGTETDYKDTLNEAIGSVSTLPKADDNSNAIFLLSAKGAAYTSSFNVDVDANSKLILSFWVKTSDMGGATAATLKLKDKGTATKNSTKEISASFTLDSTGKTVDIDENVESLKDIYKGWVQCFFFVENDDIQQRHLSFELSFGNTSIKDTKVSSYKGGWVALANLQQLDADRKTFSYVSANDTSATLTLSKNEVTYTNPFDAPLGNIAHEIKNGMVDPTEYYGVNGGSSSVINNGSVSLPFDDINAKDSDGKNFAGLICSEYVENYKDKDWYKTLMDNFVPSNASSTEAITTWKTVFGETSYQPLVVLNKIREIGGKKVINYGFIGSEKTASENAYTVVSAKVMVSAGAVANIYLVDTSEKDVLKFKTTKYSFFYDEDGNVLKKENREDDTLTDRRANILYTLRNDGLYEDSEGTLYANTWNYTKLYKDETISYYNKNGEAVSFENLKSGETYYADAGMTKLANHFLVTEKNIKVYEYKDGNYYYIVDGKTQDKVITPFDVSKARYSEVESEYKAVVDARYDKDGKFMNEVGVGVLGYDKDGKLIAGKWVTVSFVIHTGANSKSYRLELWSGDRESTGVTTDENGTVTSSSMKDNSAVLFDYSYTTVSDDKLRGWYEEEIIDAYKSLLSDKGLFNDNAPKTSKENIGYYEKLVYGGTIDGEVKAGYLNEGKLNKNDIAKYSVLNNYTAHYYTFSLYDSPSFRPFNKDTADENTTGYNYKLSDYSETLAYLEVKNSNDNEYTVFVDYAALDQNIEFVKGEDKKEDTTDEKKDETNIWLLASSILLVVAMFFAMFAILIKDLVKKMRRNKVTSKNKYNHNKAVRTMRRLKIKPENVEEVDNNPDEAVDENAVEEVVEEIESVDEKSDDENN